MDLTPGKRFLNIKNRKKASCLICGASYDVYTTHKYRLSEVLLRLWGSKPLGLGGALGGADHRRGNNRKPMVNLN